MNLVQSFRPRLASEVVLDPSYSRRSILLAGLIGATYLPGPSAFAADKPEDKKDASPDVALYCDPTLGPAMRLAGRLFRTRTQASVAVLSAPPKLMLAQIERQARDDVLITLSDAMDSAVNRGLVKPDTRVDGWRNRLVLAGRAGEVSALHATDPAALGQVLGYGRIAVTDPTVAASFDGAAILDKAGLTPFVGNKLVGAADVGDVAFLIKTGVTRLGLLYLTDVRADPALAVAATLDTAELPIAYAAALNRQAQSPNAQAFLDFLRTSQVQEQLHALGLETIA